MAIQLGSAYGKIIVDANGVVTGVETAGKSFENLKTKAAALGQSMQQLGTMMTAAFTVPLSLAAKSALGTFQEYEKALNVLGSVSNATTEQMEDLKNMANELGADLTLPGTSAADAAEAMSELAKAGLDVNEVMDSIRGVLQLSAAGQLSNAEAAEITANALNSFGLAGSEAVRVADLLAAGANSSSAEVKEMADSLQMSSAVFSNAGMKIEELVAAISIMANKGIQGSDAGTSLKQMLLSLQGPTDKSAALMKKLGIDVYDASGKMLPMRDIIEIFTSRMAGLTQEQRNAALAIIFGSDAVRAANIVLLGGVDAYDQMYSAVNKTGSAASLAAALMQGLTGSMENVKSAFETASLAAVEPFKEDLSKLLDVVSKVLNGFSNLPEPVRKFIVVGLALIAITGPILLFFGTLLSMGASVVTAMGTLGISFGSVAAGAGAVATAAGTASTAMVGFAASTLAALWPILLIIGTLYLLYKAYETNFGGIRTTLEQAKWLIGKWEFETSIKFANWADKTAITFANWVDRTSIKFANWVDKTRAKFSSLWPNLIADTNSGLSSIGNGWNAGLAIMQTQIMGWVNWLQNAWNNILKYLGDVRNRIVETFRNVDWGAVGMSIINSIANGIFGGIPNLVNAALSAAEQAWNAAQNVFSGTSASSVAASSSASANDVSRSLASSGTVNSRNQSNVTMQFANGVTLRQVQDMLNMNNEAVMKHLNYMLGGA